MSYVLTDIQPRTMMCPLPKGYWWQVRLRQRNDAAFVELWKRRNISALSTGGVINASHHTMDDLVREVINVSFRVWQDHVQSAYQKNAEWVARAAELRERLVSTPDTKVKVKVETIK